jgi:hypothetical protein
LNFDFFFFDGTTRRQAETYHKLALDPQTHSGRQFIRPLRHTGGRARLRPRASKGKGPQWIAVARVEYFHGR